MSHIDVQQSSRPLTGKVAFVTGGSRGIGAAIAKRLAREGAQVAITYVSNAKRAEEVVAQIEADKGRALAIQADNGDVGAVRAAIASTVKRFGAIDILVNNAAAGAGGPLAQTSDADFDRMVSVNLKGVFVATREVLEGMPSGGRIINIGSSLSHYTAFPGNSLYVLVKGALASFSRALARELGPRGITVNNVMPGAVDTESNPENGPLAALVLPGVAVQRYGKVEEIAAMVAHVASPAGAYITGTNLVVDGGLSA